MISERSLSWYSDAKARRQEAEQEKSNKERAARMKHGKRYKEFMNKKPETPRYDRSKGVRALHKGQWGYMKDKKFTPD
jgi:hypothetical protein